MSMVIDKFPVGSWVSVRRTELPPLCDYPPEAMVWGVVPPGFPPEHVFADLMKEPRPVFIKIMPKDKVTYILLAEFNSTPFLVNESDITPLDRPRVEMGRITRVP